MGAGECWIFDTWRRHGVVNTGDVDRIHLVMDTVGGTEFWKHAGGARPAGVAGVPAQPWTPRVVPFDPDAVTPRSEEHTSELQSLMRISYAVFGLKNTTQ